MLRFDPDTLCALCHTAWNAHCVTGRLTSDRVLFSDVSDVLQEVMSIQHVTPSVSQCLDLDQLLGVGTQLHQQCCFAGACTAGQSDPQTILCSRVKLVSYSLVRFPGVQDCLLTRP